MTCPPAKWPSPSAPSDNRAQLTVMVRLADTPVVTHRLQRRCPGDGKQSARNDQFRPSKPLSSGALLRNHPQEKP